MSTEHQHDAPRDGAHGRGPAMTRDGAFIGASVRRREDPGCSRARAASSTTSTSPASCTPSSCAAASPSAASSTSTRGHPCGAGVVAAFAADDLVMAPITALLDRPIEQFRPTEMPVLAHDTVRFIGEPVAIVVAKTPYAAEDGVEAARVEYETYDAIVAADAAMAPGARRLHDGAPDNVLADVPLRHPGVGDAFARAAEVVEISIDTGRQNALPMETRAALAQWDERESQLVLHTPPRCRTSCAPPPRPASGCPSARCASSCPTWAVASASSASSAARRWSSPRPPAGCAAR
nr:molybdopterin cofactor-binding domain-containing protein [Janibacter melonis]